MNFLKNIFRKKTKADELKALKSKIEIDENYIKQEENDLKHIDYDSLSEIDKANYDRRRENLEKKKEELKKDREKYDIALQKLEKTKNI
ncbi:MAG: hypothetical protein ACLFPM_02650 [Candidatus Izemoplasmatales bacterium]